MADATLAAPVPTGRHRSRRSRPPRCPWLMLSGSDQFVRSGRREPLVFEDAEALRRGEKLGEALGRPEVGGFGGCAGGPSASAAAMALVVANLW